MPTFTITAPDGKRYKVTGANKEGALAALKSKLEGPQQPTQPPQQPQAQPQVQPQVQPQQQQVVTPQDTSMGSAFKVADAQSQGASMSGTASLQRNLSQGPFGQFLQSATDNYINPIREGLGFDSIDRAQVDADASARLQAGADRANAEAEKIAEDLDFYNMTTSDINSVGDFVNFIGQKTAQAAPYMGAALASGGTLTYPFAVGEISQNLSEIEGLPQEKADDIAAAGGAISAALETLGIAKLLPKGTSNSILGGIASGVITEGTTEGLQELVNIGSEAVGGKQFSEGEILNRLKEAAAAGSVAGGAFKGSTQAASKAKSLFTSDGELDVNNLDNSTKLAAGDVARELQQIATAEGFKLSNVDVTAQFGAKGALEAVREQNNGEITELVKALKGKLNSKNASSLDQVLSDFAPANAGIKSGKNKVSGYVSKTQMAALARLVGPYREGAALMNALAKSNVITGLFKDGMKGGVSQFTDYFSPFGTSGAVYDPTRIGNIIVGGGAAAATLGQSVPIQAGIVGLGRLVDAATGRRNKLSRFVNKNVNAQGLPSPSGVSLVDKAKAAESDAKVRREALARIATQLDAPPNANSPVGTILSGTGLSRDGLSQTINSMAQDFAGQPELAPVLESIQQNMDGDTNPVLELNEIIPIIGQYAQMTAPELIVATPDNPLLARGVQQSPEQTQAQTAAPGQPQSGNQFTTPENYQAGKSDNNSFARSLASQVSEDAGVSVSDKAQLLTALEDVQSSLGPDPVAALDEITTELQNIGVNRDVIDTYFKPYRDRVALQQARVGRMQAPSDQAPAAPTVDQSSVANATVIEGAVRKIMEGNMDPASVEAMLNQLEQNNPGIKAKILEITDPQQDPDEPTVASMDVNPEDNNSQKPTLQTYVNPLNVPESEINATRLNESPSEADIQKMREGSYKPTKKRNLVEAADYMHQKWKEATGRSEPFEYTPENVDIISTYMATEAANALQSDANAIGWYDRKLKAAKRVVSLVDPRVTQSPDAEAAFDFALAVTSNGQAVADNFQYALEVFRHFMDNGKMPTDTWIKGGERNAAMLEAFDFFNAYQSSGANMPIQDFMDQDFTVNELNDYISRFNAQYGTEIKVPSSEGANSQVKGSYIIGPKIGQGFYQNIRGNYDPLTMDIWWMRMWNRLVGRPFVADPDLDQGRSNVKGALKTVGKLEQKMVNQTLKEMGVGKRDINKDPALFDDFVTKVEKRYQKFYKKYKEENGVNHTKPNFFKKTGTHVKNLKPQLQAQPKGPSERAYMRDVTKAAIAKLSDLGYNIETADFQALMWYPEKQLFRHLGVAPGRGSDNDYLDAAIMLAEGEGIANDQIQEALPDADGDGAVNNQPSTPRGDEGLYRGDGSDGPSQESPTEPILRSLEPRASNTGPRLPIIPRQKPEVTAEHYKRVSQSIRPAFEVGKEGSEFEDGVPDFKAAVDVARKMGIIVKLASSQKEMVVTNSLDTNKPITPNLAGAFQRVGAKKRGKGYEGTIWAMRPGATKTDGSTLSDIEALTTLLHEISHAITMSPLDGKADQEIVSYFINRQQSSKPETNISGRSDFSVPGSFVDSAIRPLLENDYNQMTPKQQRIYSEIVNLQETVDAYSPKNPNERRAVRFIRRAHEIGMSPEGVQTYKDYTRMAVEFAVDPVWVYLINPKLAKKLMPLTSKLIQSEFRKAGGKTIQFYAHPLAVVIAAFAALELARDEEEERQKQQQMAPGALTPPPGALSAA